ncbi:carbohydrate ABC transporter permease [Paenibacillus sp. HN-1]|uniref:carbohydrate ABC transporter permease n=1 Tax=Paenibacillus TaxID=44249 RepID=UPI001CA94218|nr:MULTISPECIES: carbohydrate ABC transporter permease [Paenibacillus]MBY9077920.1 carbohydrate ABC transporter permease [Paenibacillus sp. CGMCC 1.18879]MBY9087718.1 carbohydrate ABC transporter permease [Paenibacillus sinensis]
MASPASATLGRKPKNKESSVMDVSKPANLAINIFFWIYSAICVIPILLVLIVSFSDEKMVLANGYSFFPHKLSLSAYDFLLNDWVNIVRSYGISIFVTIIGTAASLLIMALFAYPISRRDFKQRGTFSFIMVFTILFNAGLVPFYMMYTQYLHLQNTLLVLIAPYLVQGFFVLVMRTFFMNSVPYELIESSKIDGAGEWRIFAQIVLPLSLPVLASVGLLCTLNYWNDWYLSMLFINDNIHINIQYRMYKALQDLQFLSSNSAAYSAILRTNPDYQLPSETVRMAMAVVGIGPIIFAYPFFQRYFIEGLTVGAVKG